MIDLYAVGQFRFPIMAECINPDLLQGKTLAEIDALQVREGNRTKKLGELFNVTMTPDTESENQAVHVHGDLRKVRRIGASMKTGHVIIEGNSGMHLGEEMKGGKITVHGNAEGWAGSMMSGGTIEVRGNAGDYLGAPYRGSNKGMSGGEIIVHGNVGNEAGAHMRKGTIKIYGDVGQFAGFRMKNGTMYIQGHTQARAGACMTGGKIVVNGSIESVLPTFTIDSLKTKVKVDESQSVNEPFYLFVGDLSEDGNGKLYVAKNRNPELSHYDEFL
jgi:formylmethanofuran dehydrogenase subunit C